MPDTTSLDIRVALANNVIEVSMGAARASIPVEQLDSFLRALEGCRLIASAGTHPTGVAAIATAPATEATAAPAPPAPATAAPATAAIATPAASAPAKAAPAAKPAAAAKPAPAPAKAADGKPAKRKRRSRKRVGDALVTWMRANPGWHSEEYLLRVVIENKMSDASPKRALKIALGKQRDDLFEGDGHGHWKLKTDTTAGEPPKPKPKERKKPGRKPKAFLLAQAAAAAAAAGNPPPAEALAEPAPAAVEPAEVKEVKAATETAVGQKRKSLRVKPKSTAPASPAATESALASAGAASPVEAEPAPAAEPVEGAEGAEDGKDTGRKVLVKQGQDRKAASYAPGEKEAREEATQRLTPRNRRWNGVSTDEVERARRNLLGLGGPATPKARPAVESDEA